MTWVKIDDRAREHVKQLKAGAEACWLWACGLMYCNARNRRDGFVPDEALAVLYPLKSPTRLAERLVTVGLWERAEGGYVIHDYHDYQPTTEQAAELSAKRSAAGRAGGIKSGATRKQVASTDGSKREAGCLNNDEAKTNPVPVPVPREEEDPQTPASGAPVRTGPVERVFDHWRSAMASPRSVLDAKRRKAIERALATHGEPTCISAVDGCRADPFSMGENDRHAKFNDVTLIFRDAAHVEKFAALAVPSELEDMGEEPEAKVSDPAPRAEVIAALESGKARGRAKLAERLQRERTGRQPGLAIGGDG